MPKQHKTQRHQAQRQYCMPELFERLNEFQPGFYFHAQRGLVINVDPNSYYIIIDSTREKNSGEELQYDSARGEIVYLREYYAKNRKNGKRNLASLAAPQIGFGQRNAFRMRTIPCTAAIEEILEQALAALKGSKYIGIEPAEADKCFKKLSLQGSRRDR